MEYVMGYLVIGLLIVGHSQYEDPNWINFLLEAQQIPDKERVLTYWILLTLLVVLWPILLLRR